MKTFARCMATVVLVSGCRTATVPEVAAPPEATSRPAKIAAAEAEVPGRTAGDKGEQQRLDHAAIGAQIKASSTHTGEIGEGPAKNLIDGDVTTRWSSEYSEPQQVTIDLGKPKTLKKLRLYWEDAAATKYTVSVSPDGKDWMSVGDKAAKGVGPRTDEFKLKDLNVQSIRLDLQNRVNTNWGFSLYEVEAITD